MITKKTLSYLRDLQMKKFNDGSSLLQDPPVGMFIDGVFNNYKVKLTGSANRNGGDNLIQKLNDNHTHSGSVSLPTEFNSDKKTMKKYKYKLAISKVQVERNIYLSVIVEGLILKDSSINEPYLNVYLFSWIKDSGKVDEAKLNGKDITESQYLWLLNLVEDSGHDLIKSNIVRHLSK